MFRVCLEFLNAYICLLSFVYMNVRDVRACTIVCVCVERSEDNEQRSVLFLYRVDPGAQTQVIRLGCI